MHDRGIVFRSESFGCKVRVPTIKNHCDPSKFGQFSFRHVYNEVAISSLLR
jgi:hypothetical protein